MTQKDVIIKGNKMKKPMISRDEFVSCCTDWLVRGETDKSTLDKLYTGKSKRIYKLVREAYMRGVRRGASCAWEAQQPIVLR